MGKFNPQDHISKIQGRDYLEVKWRIVWFRDEHPNGRIDTDIQVVGDVGIIKATIWNNDGVQVASGMATIRAAENTRMTWAGRDIEKAETAAIGRALAHAGFGTQFTGNEMDEGDYLSDAPVKSKQPSKPANVTNIQDTESGKEQFGQSTLQVYTKETAEKDKRYMTISGATLWSREPFRALGFDEHVIEQLGQVGEHILPHSVTACYVQQGVYKSLIHLRRDDTGEVVDKDGNAIAQAS
jgi:hypothetical protein